MVLRLGCLLLDTPVTCRMDVFHCLKPWFKAKVLHFCHLSGHKLDRATWLTCWRERFGPSMINNFMMDLLYWLGGGLKLSSIQNAAGVFCAILSTEGRSLAECCCGSFRIQHSCSWKCWCSHRYPGSHGSDVAMDHSTKIPKKRIEDVAKQNTKFEKRDKHGKELIQR